MRWRRAAAVLGATVLVAGCGSSGGSPRHTGPAGASSSTSPNSSSSSGGSGAASGPQAVTVHGVVERTHGTVAVFVPVTVHGKPSYFVLDSGADVSVLDSGFAKSAGLSSSPAPGTDKTIGCTKHPTISTIPNWSLGSTTLPPARLPTQSLGFGKLKIHGRPVGGLLGADVQALSGRVRIDYRTGSVTFRAAASSGGTAVTLRELHHGAGTALIAPATVHGRQLSMLVDTGASRTTLQASVAKALGLPKVGKPVTVNAAGCPASVQPVRLSGARIGGRTLPTTVIDTAAAGTPYGSSVPGAFGSDLLARFTPVALDYRSGTLTLSGS